MSRPYYLAAIPSQSSTYSSGAEESSAQGAGRRYRSIEQPPKRQYTKRGAISKIACRTCRKRKTKCTSERPSCQNCSARSEPCHYDYDESDRSLTFLRDNNENLAEERNALEAVLHALQRSPEEAALGIFQRLRAGGDLQTLSQQVLASSVLTEVSSFNPHSGPSSSLSRLDQYEQLTRGIVDSSHDEAEEIVRRLRQRVEPSMVLKDLRAGTLTQGSGSGRGLPQFLQQRSPPDEHSYGLLGEAGPSFAQAMDIDPPDTSLGSQSRPWTTVTDDPAIIEHLFTLYFSWEHNFFHSIPEKPFRADYAAKRTRYCSTMLVNAICACACLLVKQPERIACDFDYSSAGRDFFFAALAELNERSESTPCTAIALVLMSRFEGCHGRMSAMWAHTGRAGRMALDLSLHLLSPPPEERDSKGGPDGGKTKTEKKSEKNKKEDSEDSSDAKDVHLQIFWSVFLADQIASFTLGRPPQILLNSVTSARLSIVGAVDEAAWCGHYEDASSIAPGAISTTFHRAVSLCMIINSTLSLFFSPTKMLHTNVLLDEYRKYQEWKARLPEIIANHDQPPPHVISLWILWHAAVLLLFRPFLRARIKGSEVVPQDVCRHAANGISDLFSRYREAYGLMGMWSFHVQCLIKACTVHLFHIPAIASTAHFVNGCNDLHALVGRNEWADAGLNVLRDLVRNWDRILPREAEHALFRRADDHSGDELEQALPSMRGVPQQVFDASAALAPAPIDGHMEESHTASEEALPSSADSGRSTTMSSLKSQGKRKLPRLFAPSPSQPAPLVGPMYLCTADGELEQDYWDVTGIEGLDFSSADDPMNPFIGLNGLA